MLKAKQWEVIKLQFQKELFIFITFTKNKQNKLRQTKKNEINKVI